jgi:DNA topoisomerase-2
MDTSQAKCLIKVKPKTASGASDAAPSEILTVENKYKRLKHLEHILLKPGMYIGSNQSTEQEMFVYDEELTQMIKKKIKFIPGLYKIFDEGVVNTRDHQVRMHDIISEQEQIIAGKRPANPKIDPSRKYHPVTSIKINVDIPNNQIIFKNDGDGIDVAWHNKENMYVPELIFGNLLTGTNFDDKEQRTVGGLNGLGSKLISIFSTEFIIETVDSSRGLKYTQRFMDNMTVREDPVITKCKTLPYTIIKFTPDLKRFGLTKLDDDDTVLLMKKRTYDIAAVTAKDVNVWYNDKKIEIKTFERYVDLYIGARGEYKRIYSTVNPDWEIAVCVSPDNNFEQVSFVNGICTYRGGKHVDHASNIISTRLAKYSSENKKGMSAVTAKNIKDNMWLFINTTMINPLFDTQTKECFTTNISDFRAKCDVDDDLITKLSQPKLGILEKAVRLSEFKAGKGLKKSDGKQGKRIKNEKVDDAIYARDKKKCHKCILILTEGDSAQSTAMAGLSVLPEDKRKYYGVMPLRGKIINPKDSKLETIEKNKEFAEIKQVLGLKQGTEYSDSIDSLRYGRVIFMTDADKDGNHIKGLGFNLFHEFWPSLLKIEGFFCSLLTPIVKATNRSTKKILSFYSMEEYNQWKKDNSETADAWSIKYYKGLGTHTPTEAKDLFREMKLQSYSWNDLSRKLEHEAGGTPLGGNPHSPLGDVVEPMVEPVVGEPVIPLDLVSHQSEISLVNNLESYKSYYQNTKRHPCDLAFELAFAKRNADYRKGWITHYLKQRAVGDIDLNLHKLSVMSYYDFINEELIEFSVYDNERSIPCLVDGLKPSQRKIIYTTLRKKIKSDLKVSELAGKVSSETSYHHGEGSLQDTIVGLAQDFPGSNNINLLLPIGQFGTRKGDTSDGIGKDYAASRYIYTNLNPITRLIFNKIDDNLYQYLDEDGTVIEPRFFVPIIPTVLVNGARGIGTGWMTEIPSYNPHDIINNIEKYLQAQPMDEMKPWYRGFCGTIAKVSHQKYRVTGVYHRTGPKTVEITEIPLGSARESLSFMHFKNYIESLIIDDSVTDDKVKNKQILSDAETLIGDKTIKCTLYFKTEAQLNEQLSDIEAFEKQFKLSHLINTYNMNLFNADGIMTKYINPEDILLDYCKTRIHYYDLRKKYQTNQLEINLGKIGEKIRFITYINDDSHELKVQKKKKVEILQLLDKYQFKKYSPTDQKGDMIKDEDNENEITDKMTYDYLLRMPIYSLTFEQIEKLKKEQDQLQSQLDKLTVTTIHQLWIDDLKDLKAQLIIFEGKWETEYTELQKKKKIVVKNKKN